MKRNGICLIVIAVLFSLYGCNNGKNVFSDNVKIVDDQFKISSFIRGEKLLNKIFRETLYRDDDARAFSLYKSTWRLDSHGNKMVGAMRSVNQINFYSIADQKRWSIVIGEQRTDKNELINDETGLERMSTFADLEMTDTGICALYINQDYDDAYEKAKPLDLLIFDMNGNLDRVVRLNEYVIDITISGDGEYLYGRTPSDEIYRYRLVTDK